MSEAFADCKGFCPLTIALEELAEKFCGTIDAYVFHSTVGGVF
jgi:hypothetical protein